MVCPATPQSTRIRNVSHAAPAARTAIGMYAADHPALAASAVNATTESQIDSIRDLVADMRGGKVDLLVILGGNPAFDAPADLAFYGAGTTTVAPIIVE